MNRARTDPREIARRAALSALRRARRAADRAGVDLSEWEGEFLGSVEDRVKTFGRAFGDPEKGASESALSILQSVKLKEITAKAKGRVKGRPPALGAARSRAAGPVFDDHPAEGRD